MYLLLLPNTINKPFTPKTKSEHKLPWSHKPSMQSTTVPLARMYGGALPEDNPQEITTNLTLNNIEWQPVSVGDMVVYIRPRPAI